MGKRAGESGGQGTPAEYERPDAGSAVVALDGVWPVLGVGARVFALGAFVLACGTLIQARSVARPSGAEVLVPVGWVLLVSGGLFLGLGLSVAATCWFGSRD